MKQNLPELVVKAFIKPTRLCWLNAHGPVNSSEPLIMRTLKSCEVMKVGIAHGLKIIPWLRKSQPDCVAAFANAADLVGEVYRTLTSAATSSYQGSSPMIPRSGAPPGKSAQ